jgi:phosphatidylglycerophosphate synthase
LLTDVSLIAGNASMPNYTGDAQMTGNRSDGKFKTTLLIITLIVALLSIEIKIFNYLYIIFLVLTTYFHIETICAYINQLHGKSKENIVSFKDKKISERKKLLLDEFMQYIKNPIKIIK